MSDFSITFTNPWLLLLIIPGIALLLFGFFRVSKQFRYTRNRVIALSLGAVMTVSCALMLAGVGFSYSIRNDTNEVILLVDASYSNRESEEKKAEFIQSVIAENGNTAELGIVTFGYDQVYAVPLGENSENIYETYRNAPSPDNSATDIAAALEYAQGLFSHPESAKIVVLTDGIETDGEAMDVVASLALAGIRVDFADFSEPLHGEEVQISSVSLPEEVIKTGVNAQLGLSVQSMVSTDALIKVYDNGKEVISQYAELAAGANSLYFTHAFESAGLHELRFEAEGVGDTLSQNNIYYSYVYIDVVDNVLVLQRGDEAERLEQLFSDDFDVTVRNISEAPATLNELRDYDQVILMNVANADMPAGFIDILNSYVYDVGGSLFTVGGTREENGEQVANVYDRQDMSGTLYEEMLPVLAEDYTPPVAVVLVIDISGSMSSAGSSGKTLMEEAKESAKDGLRALDTRDYVGIVTFGDNANTILDMTPVAEMRRIETAIDRIDYQMSGTVYSNGLERAGSLLRAMRGGVNQKHILLISDGEPSSSDNMYINITESNLAAGITTSCISFTGAVSAAEAIAAAGEGQNYTAANGEELTGKIREDLSNPTLRSFEYETFQPQFGDYSTILNGIDEADIPALDGFFGTRLKNGAQGILVGDYGQPIYAQWDYGKGKVGSFMCDLNGTWSAELLGNDTGQQILRNIVGGLFPQESVAVNEIELSVSRENYTVGVNVYTQINDGESIRIFVNRTENNGTKALVHTINVESFSGNQTINFDITQGGVYEIEVQKLGVDGSVLASNTAYQEFSYSLEYDPFLAENDNAAHIAELAAAGGGKTVGNAAAVFDGLITTFFRTYDPRGVLSVVVIVALLLYVAVRKFKFKWPHEIIREKKKGIKDKAGGNVV